jgi:hypothetical protein
MYTNICMYIYICIYIICIYIGFSRRFEEGTVAKRGEGRPLLSLQRHLLIFRQRQLPQSSTLSPTAW